MHHQNDARQHWTGSEHAARSPIGTARSMAHGVFKQERSMECTKNGRLFKEQHSTHVTFQP